jgi:5-methylcytosine-specific restriction endonuclease McrA
MNGRTPVIVLVIGILMLMSPKTALLGLILVVVGFILIRERGRRRARIPSRKTTGDWPSRRREVWERDCGQCRVCRQPVKLSNCDIHHLTPRSKGGSDEIDNLLLLCKPCHAKMPNHQHLLRQRQYRQ